MKLDFNWVFICYYVYCVMVLILTGYVVFILNNSGWWFLVAFLMMQVTPSRTYKNDESESEKHKTIN